VKAAIHAVDDDPSITSCYGFRAWVRLYSKNIGTGTTTAGCFETRGEWSVVTIGSDAVFHCKIVAITEPAVKIYVSLP